MVHTKLCSEKYLMMCGFSIDELRNLYVAKVLAVAEFEFTSITGSVALRTARVVLFRT